MQPSDVVRSRGRPAVARSSVAAIAAVAVLALAPGRAAAHTELASSTPPAGAAVAGVDAIELRFSRAVEPVASRIRVSDTTGAVELGPAKGTDGNTALAVAVPPLGEGVYQVVWDVMAEDGARTGGHFSFTVAPAAPSGPTISGVPVPGTQDPAPATGPLARHAAQASSAPAASTVATDLRLHDDGHGAGAFTGSLARGVLDASVATLVGGLAFVAAVWPQGARVPRTRRLLWVAAILAALASFELTAVQHASAVGLGPFEALLPTNQWHALQFRFGGIAAARAVLLAASALLTARLTGRSGGAGSVAWYTAATVVALGLAETVVLLGHASTPGALATGARLFHVLGVSVWIGGLVMLLCVVVPRRRVDELLRVLPRFSALATAAVASLVVGGAVLAVDHVGTAGALPSTGYGRVLLAKVAVVAALLAAASHCRRHVRTCLEAADRPVADSVARPIALWVGTEVGLMVVVMGLTALLVSRVPPG